MQKKVEISFSQAKKYIKEGDILLFRAGSFPSIGWFIAKYGGGIHSHVGVASWTLEGNRGSLECVEFREFIGSRSVSLKNYVDENPGVIDVYRICAEITDHCFHNEFNNGARLVEQLHREFTHDVAREVTDEMRSLTGLPYGWKIIGKIAAHYCFFLRFLLYFTKIDTTDDSLDLKTYVCSTVAAHSFRKFYLDLVSFKGDCYTTPCDIAASPLNSYLFTLIPDSD